MPKRTDIRAVLVLGAGPIVIGQGCEFDYSGTQAAKALKEEGYRVILVNSNPATIMTDPGMADRTYIEPITAGTVERIIEKERPDAILPTVGGQTALNCALEIWRRGILEKYGIELIGANPDAIDKAEDRQRFNEAMERIGLKVPKNAIARSLEQAMEALGHIGLPAIIRPSFTLGGTGGGIAATEEEFKEIVSYGLSVSPARQVQIDRSLLGWKEYEMEVVRDRRDNAIIVCSIENVDPMGVHTGDSMTVAPAMTLTDKEYQRMRDASIAVLREIGVDTGGSNVQFAVNPEDGEMVVIEMNPRVSRSSALASKATGFPIAKVAAKLAVGYTLDEIKNDVTKVTPASFEPSIDYVVTKIPRFAFEKFGAVDPVLSSAMRSVGEAMSIGRSFCESLQKGLRSMETGLTGLNAPKNVPGFDPRNGGFDANREALLASLPALSPDRMLRIAEAMRYGADVASLAKATCYDPWFLKEIKRIVDAEAEIKANGLPEDADGWVALKQLGFGDARLSELAVMDECEIRSRRLALGVAPVYKTVDTCAGEFPSFTPYMYSCYEQTGRTNLSCCEANPSNRKKIVILGSGPNRIGQGIEFDYACVHACFALSEMGIETVMINCNPETVSTDYDTSDRLYFEPLTRENVLDVIRKEQENGELLGVIVQFGGQTPLKLAPFLAAEGVPIVGTSPDKIDLAEDRERFRELLAEIGLRQPTNAVCFKVADVRATADEVGFPCVVRPSNVLGGRAMEIVHGKEQLERYLRRHADMLPDGPILIDRFLDNAIELDVDAVADGTDVYVAGIMEHIEEAGVHSGDSACVLPTFSLSDAMRTEIRESTVKLARALGVVGLMNVQYAVKDGLLYVLEANPRASRTVPFVAKATGVGIAKIGAQVMAGKPLSAFDLREDASALYAVKEAVFPFAKFPGVDTVLGPEMKSTGEVMGMDATLEGAFAKAQEAAGNPLPEKGNVLFTVEDRHKPQALEMARRLQGCGFSVFATRNTALYFKEHGMEGVTHVNKEHEGGRHVINLIKEGEVQLLINTNEVTNESLKLSYAIRRNAVMAGVPYVTTMRAAKAVTDAIVKRCGGAPSLVHALQDMKARDGNAAA
jgi:carbamoyl-phosphate synthase large subunit